MKKRILLIALAIVLVAAAIFGVRRILQSPDADSLVLSGTIEAADVELSFRIPGRIAERPLSEGEMTRAGAIVARLDETDLGRIRLGMPVSVRTDTFPDKAYPGHIAFIAADAEFTPKSVQTEKERVKLVYRVKIDVSNSGFELKPGMPADAEIALPYADVDATTGS